MPSFHIDLYSGRPQSEVDYLNGAVVRFGEKLGLKTPVNRWLTRTLLALAEGRLEIGTYARQPERLIDAIFSPEADT
jgi:2-dehydropantoate 2-reductase